jgi:ferredoxin
MFTIRSPEKVNSITTNIIKNVSLASLLDETYKTTEIIMCPTQAISIANKAIYDDRCIACGICKKLISYAIEYSPEEGDKVKFLEYCKEHKMFVYKWLCLSSYSLAGVEIFIDGFSRKKRLPFVSFDSGLLKIAKCANNVREFPKVQAELNDILDLLSCTIEVPTEKMVVFINEPTQREFEYITQQSGCKIFWLSELYDKFVKNLL